MDAGGAAFVVLLALLAWPTVVAPAACPVTSKSTGFHHSTNSFVKAATDRQLKDTLIEERKVRWLHTPKTGTSFFNTLIHRCSPGLDSRIALSKNEFASNLNRKLSKHRRAFTLCDVPTNFHNPFKESGEGEECPFWVTLVRNPVSRLRSSYLVGGHAIGFHGEQLATARAARNLVEFSEVPGIKGCQTRMISGKGHCASASGETPSADEAIEVLKNDFAFVGITEEWLKSVCLFHAMYGGEVLKVELANNRPASIHNRFNRRRVTVEEEAQVTDPEDMKVYQFALEWFAEQVAAHKIAVDLCVLKHSIRKL